MMNAYIYINMYITRQRTRWMSSLTEERSIDVKWSPILCLWNVFTLRGEVGFGLTLQTLTRRTYIPSIQSK